SSQASCTVHGRARYANIPLASTSTATREALAAAVTTSRSSSSRATMRRTGGDDRLMARVGLSHPRRPRPAARPGGDGLSHHDEGSESRAAPRAGLRHRAAQRLPANALEAMAGARVAGL